MSISLTTTMPGAVADYSKYLYGQPVRKDRENESILLDFALAPIDSAFVPLQRGAYITFNTATYGKWFTGYVTADPEREYLGTTAGVPKWVYRIEATADDYILNLSTVGVQPLYVGVTMGTIIKNLAALLCPGVFDVTDVDDGPLVASYQITPDKRFKDIVKDFCDSACYLFWASDHKLHFKRQDFAPSVMTVDASSKNFTPSDIKIAPALNVIMNDAVVVGDVEPQAYITEYIVGNGFAASFPLMTGVYGADYYVLLQEDFSGNSFSSTNWNVFDHPTNFLQLFNGYLNIVGGPSDGLYNVNLQSVYPIQLEGALRLTHGEWDFVPQYVTGTTPPTNLDTGVICSLWTQTPNSSLTGCAYGLRTHYNGSGVLTLFPIINGAVDTTQSMFPDTSGSKRYVIRTIATFNQLGRIITAAYAYRNAVGNIAPINAGSSLQDLGYYTTHITEIDVTTGLVTNTWTFNNDSVTIASNYLYATYVPVVSDNFHGTVSGITLSVPLQASLDLTVMVPMDGLDLQSGDPVTHVPSNWTAWSNAVIVSEPITGGNTCLLTNPTVIATTSVISKLTGSNLLPNQKYNVSFVARKDAGANGTLTIGVLSTSLSYSSTFTMSAASLLTASYTSITGSFTAPGTIPADLVLSLAYTGGSGTFPNNIYVYDIVITIAEQAQLIGPNDINSLDGLITVATIDSVNNLPQTTTVTGVPVYNAGASSLVFFKDTAKQTSTTPQPNQLYRLCYRASNNCFGRARNKVSIASEAALWGDSGVRSITKTDLKPRPRNSSDATAAAAAMVGQDGYQHYDGTVRVYSPFSGGLPIAGTILQFTNLPAGFPAIVAEEIHEVTTTFLSSRPTELFQHEVSFGEADYVRRTISQFSPDKGSFAEYVLTQDPGNQIVDISNIGLTFAPDVTEPLLTSWDSQTFNLTTNQAPPTGGGFEIRSSDTGWGCDDGRTLVTRLTGGARTFSIQRQDQTRAVFIKAYDIRNQMPYSEDQSQANYTIINSSLLMIRAVNPDGRYSNVGNLTLSPTTSAASLTASTITFPALGQQISGSVSIYAPPISVGTTVMLRLLNGVNIFIQTITLSAGWQRYTVTAPAINGSAAASLRIFKQANTSSVNIYVSRFSIEYGTNVETAYCKTLANPYGALSKFPAAVRLAFPPSGAVGAFVDATLQVDTLNATQFISAPSVPVTVTSTSVVVPDALVKSLTSTAAVTLAAVPVINGGVNGQQLTIMNVGTFPITLPCNKTLSGSSIALGSDVVLGANGVFTLIYISNVGWVNSAATVAPASGGPGYFTVAPASGNATIDLVNGGNQRIVLNGSALNILKPIFTGNAILAGMSFTLYLDQDSGGNRAVPGFAFGSPGCFVSNTQLHVQMIGTASTRTALTFVYDGSFWNLTAQLSGIATS